MVSPLAMVSLWSIICLLLNLSGPGAEWGLSLLMATSTASLEHTRFVIGECIGSGSGVGICDVSSRVNTEAKYSFKIRVKLGRSE